MVRGIANGSALDGVPLENRSSEYVAHQGSIVESGAIVMGGSSIGRNAHIGVGALVDGSIVCDGAKVLAGAQIRNSFVAADTTVSAQLNIVDSYISQGEITRLLPL